MERARPSHAADGARLIELGNEALADVSATRGGRQLVRSVLAGRSVPEAFGRAMDDPDALVVVGELAGAVLGFGVIEAGTPGPGDPMTGGTDAAGVASVRALFVEEPARGVGLGEAMLNAMSAWALTRGCGEVDAVALPGNRAAKSFFETHGMVARALVMHRRLVAPGSGDVE